MDNIYWGMIIGSLVGLVFGMFVWFLFPLGYMIGLTFVILGALLGFGLGTLIGYLVC